MRESSRELPPVRLPNPTAESFMASLRVVHFFAIFFFWLVLVAMLLHLAAFGAIRAGAFDVVLRSPEGPEAATAPALTTPAPAPAVREGATDATATGAAEEEAEAQPWWTKQRAGQWLPLVKQLGATMRLVGLLASALLLVTLFVYLEIALLGRLAGVRYLTLSFFLMMFFVATVYSWEPLLPGNRIIGSLYVFDDLLNSYTTLLLRGKTLSVGERMFFYVRFLVLPLFSFALLLVSWQRFHRGYEESVLQNE